MTRLALALVASLAVAPAARADATPASAKGTAAARGTKYGAGVSGAQLVRISELRANPDRYVGKTVRVEGLVADVCPRRGCWMEIASDQGSDTIRVKVDDGVIVFPLSAKGKVATAEGVFTKIEVPADAVAEMRKHEAEEKGAPYDPKAATGPEVVYQIKGTGAVVR